MQVVSCQALRVEAFNTGGFCKSPNYNGSQVLSFIFVLFNEDIDSPGMVSLMREFGIQDTAVKSF